MKYEANGYTVDVWRYEIDGAWEVIAGKTDADNDVLSIRIAERNDLWFHVHGLPGSHVLLRVPDGHEPEKDVIKQAAAVAAWHSKARNAGMTPVSCCRAQWVSKPRGAKPGLVYIKNDRTLKVRPAIP